MTVTLRVVALWAGLCLAIVAALPVASLDLPLVLVLAFTGALYIAVRWRPLMFGQKTGLWFHVAATLFLCICWAFGNALLHGPDRWEAVHQFGRFWLFVSLLVVALRHTECNGPGTLTIIVSLAISVHVLGALVEVLALGGSTVHGFRRLSGLAGSPNNLANLLMVGAIWFFALLISALRRRRGEGSVYFSLSLFVACVAVMVLTATLKNLLAFIMVLGVFFVLSFRRVASVKLFLGFFVALAVSGGLTLGNSTFLSRVSQTVTAGVDFQVQPGEDRASSSLQWRILHWKLLTDSWIEKAPLKGVGLGQARHLSGLPRLTGDDREGRTAHSDVLQSILELGAVAGAIANAAVLLILLWMASLVRQARESGPYLMAASLSGIALWLAAAFGNVVGSAAFLYVYPLILGGAIGAIRRTNLSSDRPFLVARDTPEGGDRTNSFSVISQRKATRTA